MIYEGEWYSYSEYNIVSNGYVREYYYNGDKYKGEFKNGLSDGN